MLCTTINTLHACTTFPVDNIEVVNEKVVENAGLRNKIKIIFQVAKDKLHGKESK